MLDGFSNPISTTFWTGRNLGLLNFLASGKPEPRRPIQSAACHYSMCARPIFKLQFPPAGPGRAEPSVLNRVPAVLSWLSRAQGVRKETQRALPGTVGSILPPLKGPGENQEEEEMGVMGQDPPGRGGPEATCEAATGSAQAKLMLALKREPPAVITLLLLGPKPSCSQLESLFAPYTPRQAS